MSLRAKFVLYWVLLHAAFAVSMGILLWDKRVWLLAVEGVILLSLLVAFRLAHRMHKPLELVQQGAELIRDNFASASFQLTGHAEVNSVLNAYNLMLESLRKERQRMQEQHFLLEKIVAASPSGILMLDFDDRIAMANPKACRLLNCPQNLLLALPLQNLPEPMGKLLAGLTEGETQVLTLPTREVIRCTRSSFFDQGFSRGFLLLEELTEEVRASEKAAFEKAIRVLSHEVNNSIGAAHSLLHSLFYYKPQLQPTDQEDFDMALQVVLSRTEHLNKFMRSYVDVIRLPDPHLQRVELKSLVQQTIKLFEAELENRQIILELNWQAADHLQFSIDAGQIGQVLVNILKNALEAIGNEGYINIRFLPQAGLWKLEIADSGPGISDQAKAQLFSPFFSTKQNGQGIGLSLVQEILQRHQLLFSLENEPGSGAVFRIVFPDGV